MTFDTAQQLIDSFRHGAMVVLVDDDDDRLANGDAQAIVHLVGHSFGGLIVLHALEQGSRTHGSRPGSGAPPPGRVVRRKIGHDHAMSVRCSGGVWGVGVARPRDSGT